MKKYFLFFTILLTTNIVLSSQEGGATTPPSQASSMPGSPPDEGLAADHQRATSVRNFVAGGKAETMLAEDLLTGQSMHNFGVIQAAAAASTRSTPVDLIDEDDDVYPPQEETETHKAPEANQTLVNALWQRLVALASRTAQLEKAKPTATPDGCEWNDPDRKTLLAMLQEMTQPTDTDTLTQRARKLHLLERARATISSTGSLDTILDHNRNGTIAIFFDELEENGEHPGDWLNPALAEANATENPFLIAQVIDITNMQETKERRLMEHISPVHQRDASEILVRNISKSIKERLPRLQVTTDAEQAAHTVDPMTATQRQIIKAMVSAHRRPVNEVDSEDDDDSYTRHVTMLQHIAEQKDFFMQERHTRRNWQEQFFDDHPTNMIANKSE